jgi:hypothetical protein
MLEKGFLSRQTARFGTQVPRQMFKVKDEPLNQELKGWEIKLLPFFICS